MSFFAHTIGGVCVCVCACVCVRRCACLCVWPGKLSGHSSLPEQPRLKTIHLPPFHSQGWHSRCLYDLMFLSAGFWSGVHTAPSVFSQLVCVCVRFSLCLPAVCLCVCVCVCVCWNVWVSNTTLNQDLHKHIEQRLRWGVVSRFHFILQLIWMCVYYIHVYFPGARPRVYLLTYRRVKLFAGEHWQTQKPTTLIDRLGLWP